MRAEVWIPSLLCSRFKRNLTVSCQRADIAPEELPCAFLKGALGTGGLCWPFCTKYFAQSLLSAKMKIWQVDGRKSLLWPKWFCHCDWEPSYLTSVFNNVELCSWACSLGWLYNQLGNVSRFKAQFSGSVLSNYFSCLNGLSIKMWCLCFSC